MNDIAERDPIVDPETPEGRSVIDRRRQEHEDEMRQGIRSALLAAAVEEDVD
jgi:hypothetical protein